MVNQPRDTAAADVLRPLGPPGHGDVVRPCTADGNAIVAVERDRLLAVLGPWLRTAGEHIGSISVPGMTARPVIDLSAGIRDLRAAAATMGPLGTRDYRHRPHRPSALFLHRPRHGRWEHHTHHLDLTEPGSDIWRERLAFRDALRDAPALVDEYNDWKRCHGRVEFDGPYDHSKTPFVARVLAGPRHRAQARRPAPQSRRTPAMILVADLESPVLWLAGGCG